MSQDQQDTIVGRLVRQRNDAKKQLAMLQEEARELSKQFSGFGEMLKPENVWNIALESYQHLLSKESYEKLGKLKAEIPSAEQELARLNDEMRKFE